MLPLDSPMWGELNHVYGSAEDSPQMLRALEKLDQISWGESSGPLDTFISAHYHQGDPNSAALAAVPHLLRIGKSKGAGSLTRLLILIGWIESVRDDAAPLEATALLAAYDEAIAEALELSLEAIQLPITDNEDFRHVLGAIAAFRGKKFLALRLFELDALYDEYLEKHGEDFTNRPKF